MSEPRGSVTEQAGAGGAGFDAARAAADIAAIAFPRRVGTPAEREAARHILRSFESSGLTLKQEPFQMSHFPTEVGAKLIFAGCIALLIAGATVAASLPLLAALFWLIPVYLINAPWRLARYVGSNWPPRAYSENLLGTLPTAGRAPARVIFMAHYDSKSQVLPTGVRVALVSTATSLSAIWALLGFAAAVGLPQTLELIGIWTGPAFISVLLVGLILNLTGDRSPGALDNGSGVGTLLELARSWRPRSGAPVDTVYVATGAEEAGLDGARHFLKLHDAWWSEKPTLLINLESVGTGPRLYLAGQYQSLRLAHAVAEELGMPHQSLRVLGAGMDHQPFAAAGLNAVSILGDVVRASFAMHSPRDNLGIIERQALERAGRLAAHLAWCWAELHQSAAATLAQTVPATNPLEAYAEKL